MYDNSGLVTRLKNTSGHVLTCSFLPPHGITLGVNEEIEVYGDIIAVIRSMKRTGAQRLVDSYIKALDDGLLTIVSTPSVVLEDVNRPGRSRMLQLANGSLRVVEPTWEESLSE